MELKDLQYFVAVAEAGGFRRAAAHLNVRQSVLSRRVRDVEEELGVSILERHRSGVSLTHAGRDFFETARSVLAELSYGAKRAGLAGTGAIGHLRIGIFASLASGFSRDAVAAFVHRHPAVAVELSEGAPRDHILRIQERRLDIAILTELTKVEGLQSERMWAERVAVALPIDHVSAHIATLTWEQLSRQRFIVSSEEPGPEIHNWLIGRLATFGRPMDIVRFGVARETLLVMVGLGLGITVVSEAATGVSYPGVVYRFLDRDEDLLPFHLVWSDENDNPVLRRFLSLGRAMASGRPLPEAP